MLFDETANHDELLAGIEAGGEIVVAPTSVGANGETDISARIGTTGMPMFVHTPGKDLHAVAPPIGRHSSRARAHRADQAQLTLAGGQSAGHALKSVGCRLRDSPNARALIDGSTPVAVRPDQAPNESTEARPQHLSLGPRESLRD